MYEASTVKRIYDVRLWLAILSYFFQCNKCQSCSRRISRIALLFVAHFAYIYITLSTRCSRMLSSNQLNSIGWQHWMSTTEVHLSIGQQSKELHLFSEYMPVSTQMNIQKNLNICKKKPSVSIQSEVMTTSIFNLRFNNTLQFTSNIIIFIY